MTPLSVAPAHTPRLRSTRRTMARWMVSFAGFPLGGFAAMVLTGPVDSPGSALVGGLVSGSVLGAVQAWAMDADQRLALRWIPGHRPRSGRRPRGRATLVGLRTGLPDLAVQGAVSGAAVGVGQALALRSRAGAAALAWPLYLAAAWTVGWVTTTAIGVRVDEQFTLFGSAGALTVALLTCVLPLHLRRPAPAAHRSSR